ncbi:hypothetical protein K0M31_016218 [Melipona bicolor]|uniref:Uncharacterized protein n=1 Tax=Melipona bicolor TaxID=60889 RepID=A0AA40G6P0_9HYME|nr:hypothetical protein K0M31_016218 [Melipona bicolor]
MKYVLIAVYFIYLEMLPKCQNHLPLSFVSYGLHALLGYDVCVFNKNKYIKSMTQRPQEEFLNTKSVLPWA